jgi:predicted nucleotidyltransferase
LRLTNQQKRFINTNITKISGNVTPYLFGSRVNDNAKGGDIDLLVLAEKKPHHSEIFKFKLAFCKEFGAQKIDVVCFTYNDEDPFKKYILSNAIKL